MKPFENELNELLAGPGKIATVYAGTGPCTLCGCDGYTDDGSGFSRCKCGDRKMDHRAGNTETDSARELELVNG